MNAVRAACLQCGLPLRRAAAEFCCSGCAVAFELRGAEGDEASANSALLARIVVSAVLATGVMVFSFSLYGLEGENADEAAAAMRGLQRLAALLFTVPIFVLLGLPLYRALPRIGRRLSADALVLAGITAGALVSIWNTFFDGSHVYFETVSMVLVLIALGRWLELRAKERARSSLTTLLGDGVELATRLTPESNEESVDPRELALGDRILVRPGQTIPVDGTVESGSALLDTASLTGESLPRRVTVGSRVLAGTLPTDGALTVRAVAVVGTRVQDAIEAALNEALASRGALVQLSDRVATWFLPLVLSIAAGTFVWHVRVAPLESALLHSLSVLLIACPCALGLATPLAAWVALGEAWRRGVLVRGGDVLERLARARRVYFDKTGTLTEPEVALRELVLEAGNDRRDALCVAASLELASEHPLAASVLRAWDREGSRSELSPVTDFRVLPGLGVEGRIAGSRYELLRTEHTASVASSVDLRKDGTLVARLLFQGSPRAEAPSVIAALRARGLQLAILSGDGRGPTAALAGELDVPFEAELLPTDKSERVGAAGLGTVFVGDGLNDAAALAAADVGIAMQGASPRSLESAAVNLLSDDLAQVPFVLEFARRATKIARWNLFWAFAYNSLGVGLAASGHLTPVIAAGAMVLSSAFVVGNSLRLGTRSAQRSTPTAPPLSAPAVA